MDLLWLQWTMIGAPNQGAKRKTAVSRNFLIGEGIFAKVPLIHSWIITIYNILSPMWHIWLESQLAALSNEISLRWTALRSNNLRRVETRLKSWKTVAVATYTAQTVVAVNVLKAIIPHVTRFAQMRDCLTSHSVRTQIFFRFIWAIFFSCKCIQLLKLVNKMN